MRSQEEIQKKIDELMKTLRDAQIRGISKKILTFSDFRKFTTQKNTLKWVLDEKLKWIKG